MFQTYNVATRPEDGPPRLKALRAEMKAVGIDAYLVPRADAWQGEYVADCDERLAYLTGFTGSAGFAAITQDIAGVFIDGRYRLQVLDQVAADFTPVHWPEVQLATWLLEHLPAGATLGFDPWVHTVSEIAALRQALAAKNIDVVPVNNLIDAIWADRPAPPAAPFFAHPLETAGVAHEDKIDAIANGLNARGETAVVITLPDSIAWALNIRGNCVAHNPVPQAYLIVTAAGRAALFAREGKAVDILEHLGPRVSVHPQDELLDAIAALEGPVQIDPKFAPELVGMTLAEMGTSVQFATDPCILPKACKNETELNGMRTAHDRDAVAMINFLAWLEEEAPSGTLTEIDIARKLEGFRAAGNELKEISFSTISGSGPNGAIVHYRVNEETNRTLGMNELMLVDSGAQYLDGTTDITRTLLVGEAPLDSAANYTRVLQGVIGISRLRFPRGLAGMHLDAIARFPLWTAGFDYDHGTGHGVGAYLSVHEGPQRLARISDTPLQEGMILSNEPGYYRAGAYGIRIENLIITIKAPPIEGADDRDMLAFETLTYVPFERRLIVTEMLSPAERAWIDAYHAEVLARSGAKVEGKARLWLEKACAAL